MRLVYGSNGLPFSICLLTGLLISSLVATAQTNPNTDNGVKSFGSYDAHSIDLVDIATGALSLHIPLVNYPQRGNLPALKYFIGFQSKAFAISGNCLKTGGESTCRPEWGSQNSGLYGSGAYVSEDNGMPGLSITLLGTNSPQYYAYTAIDSDGAKHPMVPAPWGTGFMSRDSSGFYCSGCVANSIPSSYTVYTRNGINGSPQSSGYALEDPNGNEENIAFDTSGTVTDSLARTAGTVTSTSDFTGCPNTPFTTTSALIMSVPGYNATTHHD